MSDSCVSCSGDSCGYTSSTSSADSSSIDYSSPLTSSVYADINNSGGLDAAIKIYGINLAKDIYLENSSNPEKIADCFNDTDLYGVDNLPYGVAGKIESSIVYDSTGNPNINSNIFYDKNLSADDMLYTTLHELAHREQLEYSKNMLLSFEEGDAEYTADNKITNYLDQLEELYHGSLNTKYTSDSTYNECKALVTDIYEAIGGRDEFYNALKTHDGDFFQALDSFESDLKDNGIGLENVYNALNMLNRELNTKRYDIDNISQPTSTPYPFADNIYSDTIPQGFLGTIGMGMSYQELTPFDITSNFPLADPLYSNKDDWGLLRELDEILKRYQQNM